jgi:hypothetical protein
MAIPEYVLVTSNKQRIFYEDADGLRWWEEKEKGKGKGVD